MCEALLDIQARWDHFALQLGLSNDRTINAMKRKHHNDPEECLKGCLEVWLKGNYEIQQHGHPSWRRICIATASPAGGENRKLAKDIASNHFQQMISPINKGIQ